MSDSEQILSVGKALYALTRYSTRTESRFEPMNSLEEESKNTRRSHENFFDNSYIQKLRNHIHNPSSIDPSLTT